MFPELTEVRLRFGKGARRRFDVAEARAVQLRALARTLTKAKADPERAARMLDDAAVASEREFDAIMGLARELLGNKAQPKALTEAGPTFQSIGEDWTSGKLNALFPDHVKLKRSADRDGGRLDALYAVIGDIPITRFRLADAERAMAALPKDLASATRRQYAQLISKVCRIGVYPLKAIERSPLPTGFLPKVKSTKAHSYLYPDEDAQLLKASANKVPLDRRLLYGFLAREGLRFGEAVALRWGDVDLERGVVKLDKNKTEDPRAWSLTPGVAEALAAFKPEGVKATERVFFGLDGEHCADIFRADLKAAGITRAELFERSKTRLPVRVHDLRATFVTLALANGKTESWVSDRTGHRSSVMLNRYRRAARTAAELGLGSLLPLVSAIPDFGVPAGPGNGPKGGPKTSVAPWRNGRRRGLKIGAKDRGFRKFS